MSFAGGPYLEFDEDNIHGKSEAPFCIKPFNMPYARMTENLDLICKAAFDASYEPWEWWIDRETGDLHFNERKGSDKSATIGFVAVNIANYCNVNLGKTSKSLDSKKSVQRLRLTGKSEGRRQDEITSNWQVNEASMIAIGTFYEEVISEKMVSGRETINDWARVYLAHLHELIQEIEVTIERDPYPSGSWEVGDDVWLYDPKSRITAGAYRIKRATTSLRADGEHITLTVTNAWQDITDAIADIYTKIRQMQMTGFVVEDWTAGGSNQSDVQAQEMENLWDINREYEIANELQEVEGSDPSNSQSYTAVGQGVQGMNVYCNKERLDMMGPTAAVLNQNLEIGTALRFTDWTKDPRFHVKMLISEAWKVDNTNDQYMEFGIGDAAGTDIFMFRIFLPVTTTNAYRVDCVVVGATTVDVRNEVAWIGNEEMHDFEAQVDWDDRYIFFYLDKKPIAVIPIPADTEEVNDMSMMRIIAWWAGTGDGFAHVEFYTWKTQAKAEAQQPI